MVQIWLSQGTTRLRLPILPETISVSIGREAQRVTLQELGEAVLPGARALRTLSLASYFPEAHDHNAAYLPLPPAGQAADLLKTWSESAAVVQLAITGGAVETKMPVLIEKLDLSISRMPGRVDYSMTLVEYRELTVERYRGDAVTSGHRVPAIPTPPPPPPPPIMPAPPPAPTKPYTPPSPKTNRLNPARVVAVYAKKSKLVTGYLMDR